MNLVMVTLNNEAFRDLAICSVPEKASYCVRYGYRFVSCSIQDELERPPSWYKIKVIEETLHLGDWVFWTDCDSIVWNPDLPLMGFADDRYDLILSTDLNGINSGNFFIKNSGFIKDLLKQWWDAPVWTLNHMWWEQKQLMLMHQNSEELRRKTKLVDQKYFNAYVPSVETVIRHYAAMPIEERLKAMRERL
jgi:hypothetical protein